MIETGRGGVARGGGRRIEEIKRIGHDWKDRLCLKYLVKVGGSLLI